MKKQLPCGLLVEGTSAKSSVLRLSGVLQEVGPIKSASLRAARRVATFLHAGYGVETYEELQDCRLVLIRAPDAAVPRLVSDICESALSLESLSFVLCESWLSTDVLKPLADLGASTATVTLAATLRRRLFIQEGYGSAVRQLRRLIEQSDARVLDIPPSMKSVYFAVELLVTALPVPLLNMAQSALRDAGISGKQLHSVLEDMIRKMFRDFSKGSRGLSAGPLSNCSPDAAEANFSRLRNARPDLARLVDSYLSSALTAAPSTKSNKRSLQH